MTHRPGILLDRDGTLCVEDGFLTRPDELRLLPGAAEAIRDARRLGLLAALVTNQSAVGRGLIDPPQLRRIHRRLARLLAERGARLDAVYHCPHHPQAALPRWRVACPCRKPAPGMLLRARDALALRAARTYVIGDRDSDVMAARAAQMRAVLVRTGHGRTTEAAGRVRPDHVAEDLPAALEWIRRDLRQREASA